ncbi:MAG: FecR family protein [Petrimonas sp.]|uniref:FecR family protein n=1 Tax=Petrimonas sp. TaxID=2023866 RepID=UPI002B3F8763|nr:FecR family protein [Petrimonas sp.]
MDIPHLIIEKVLEGKATLHEVEQLNTWRMKSCENETVYQMLKNERQFAEKEHDNLVIPDKEKVWNQISRRISFKKPVRMYPLREIVAIAAMVALLFMAVGYAVSLIDFGKARRQLAYTTISTPEGQKSKAVLPDGTEVWLNSGSSISYSNLFAAGNREISMSGQAYFNVAHDEEMPFNLSIDGTVSLTVLGTSFNVKSDNQTIEVALNEGSVQLSNSKNNAGLALLKPMEKAVIEKESGALVCRVTAMSEFDDNVWSLQELKFEDASFARIVSKLEKRYGVNIEFSNINPEKRYWLSIKNETLDETLFILDKIVPLTYSISDKNVTIKGK